MTSAPDRRRRVTCFPLLGGARRAALLVVVAGLLAAGCLSPTPSATALPGPAEPSGSARPTPTPVPGAPTAGPPGPSILVPPPIR